MNQNSISQALGDLIPASYPVLDARVDGTCFQMNEQVKPEDISSAALMPDSAERERTPERDEMNHALPDYMAPNLDIVFVGINPGFVAAKTGRYYAGSGNHFWKLMYQAGLIPEPLCSDDDFRLPEFGIGLTNVVERTTQSSSDLKPQEMREGSQVLLRKLNEYRPKVAVFNGKDIYKHFSGKKEFNFGRQQETLTESGVEVYVLPSSSARCAQLPRIVDKLPYYVGLKKLVDHLNGRLDTLNEDEVVFSSSLKTPPKKKQKDSPRKSEKAAEFQLGSEAGPIKAPELMLEQLLSGPSDHELVVQHIMESVAAVVQRCRDGTLVVPEHYIRPTEPGKTATPPVPPASDAHNPGFQAQQYFQQQQQRPMYTSMAGSSEGPGSQAQGQWAPFYDAYLRQGQNPPTSYGYFQTPQGPAMYNQNLASGNGPSF